jgi:hypothetical protein
VISVKDLKEKLKYSSNEIAPAFRRAGQDRIAQRLDECGDFVRVAYCVKCHAKHLSGAKPCRNRYCPVCSKLRSLLWVARLIPLLEHWIDGGGYLFLLNLTIKDTPTLKEGLDTLTGAWRTMTHEGRKNRDEWKTRFAGGVRSLEVKRGHNSGLWHPHYHAILLRRHFGRDWPYFSEKWQDAVRKANGRTEKGGSVWLHSVGRGKDKTLLDAVVECFKYMTKFEWHGASPATINELVKTLHSRKGIQTWGVLYGLAEQTEEQFEKSDYEDLRGFVCRACGFHEFEFDLIARSEFEADTDIGDLVKIDDGNSRTL